MRSRVGERCTGREVQWDSGAVVQIRWTVGLNILAPFQSLALQRMTETRLRLKLACRRQEDPPEHRLLGHWQSLVDHVEAGLNNLRVDVRAKDQVYGCSRNFSTTLG